MKGRSILISESKIKNSKIVHQVIFDRIELGTYIIASTLLAKKNLTIDKINPKIIKSEIDVLKKIGVKIIQKKNSIIVKKGEKLKNVNITTKPYPGFPTDLQAQLMVLLTQVNGVSKIKEDIFENRFMHVPELRRMGAQIEIKGKTAIIKGPTKLTGAEVMATDLRASVSLVLAGLIAENRTIINRIYHLDRGYEYLERKLRYCKAEIKEFKMEPKNLKLIARTEEDLRVVSAHLQDSIASIADIANLKKNKIFLMQLNRFMWEDVEKGVFRKNKRIRTILKFENVLTVDSKNINQLKKDKFLDFLAIETNVTPDNNYEMKIIFAGDSIIRIFSEVIEVTLDDQGEAWDTKNKPKHKTL